MDFGYQTFSGRVIKKTITRGKKKFEVNALITKDGREFVLRHEGKTAMDDEELSKFEGKEIVATGEIQSFVLVLSEIKEIN